MRSSGWTRQDIRTRNNFKLSSASRAVNELTLHYQATIDDPGAYSEPWTTTEFQLRWRAGQEPFEYICQHYNQGPELMLGTQESIDNSHFFVPVGQARFMKSDANAFCACALRLRRPVVSPAR